MTFEVISSCTIWQQVVLEINHCVSKCIQNSFQKGNCLLQSTFEQTFPFSENQRKGEMRKRSELKDPGNILRDVCMG